MESILTTVDLAAMPAEEAGPIIAGEVVKDTAAKKVSGPVSIVIDTLNIIRATAISIQDLFLDEERKNLQKTPRKLMLNLD